MSRFEPSEPRSVSIFMRKDLPDLFRGLALGFIVAPVIYAFTLWPGPEESDPAPEPFGSIEFEDPPSSPAEGFLPRNP